MKADDQNVRSIFSNAGNVQYRLPRFQRAYAWRSEQWNTLWEDIKHIHESHIESPGHFMGAMVVVTDGHHGALTVFSLVDGQQRLLTISILLLAIDGLCTNEGLHQNIQGFLTNSREQGDLHFKILPTDLYGDRETWKALIAPGDVQNASTKPLIIDAYEFFKKKVEKYAQQGDDDLEKIFTTVLDKLLFVYIHLDRAERPYQIFESLNAKNVQLKLPDLMRNFVAMQLPEPESNKKDIFDKNWLPIESILEERRIVTRRRGELTYFLRHYLARMSSELPNFDGLYALFRKRVENCQNQDNNTVGFKSEMVSLHRYAGYYNKLLRPNCEPNMKLREQLKRLNNLEISAAHPLLLFLYEKCYNKKRIACEDFCHCLKDLENYLIRRFLAGKKPLQQTRLYPRLIRDIDDTDIVVSLRKALLKQKSYPQNGAIKQNLKATSIYQQTGNRGLRFVLLEVNHHLAKGSDGKSVLDDQPTIEHILPQNLNASWRSDLGKGAEETIAYQNNIGNLTIVSHKYNLDELANNSFAKKRVLLSKHILHINNRYPFGDVNCWNSHAIQKRADWLIEHILALWPDLNDRSSIIEYTNTSPTSLIVYEHRIPVRA